MGRCPTGGVGAMWKMRLEVRGEIDEIRNAKAVHQKKPKGPNDGQIKTRDEKTADPILWEKGERMG